MVALETLEILRFRNVEPGTVLRFQKGQDVFLGKNATGKTTLLDLVASTQLSFGNRTVFVVESRHVAVINFLP